MEAGCTVHVEAAGERRPPRRRGGVQGARPRAATGGRAGRRRASARRKGERVKVVLADYGAGNLRCVTSALARAGARARRSPSMRRRSARRRSPSSPGSATSRAPRAGLRPTASTRRSASARLQGGRCSASASACSSSSARATRAAAGSSFSRAPCGGRAPDGAAHGLEHARPDAGVELIDGLDGEDVYFAHSFAVEPIDDDVVVAVADHDGRVVAAVERGAVAGVQFHPERSARAGGRLLENALAWSRSA